MLVFLSGLSHGWYWSVASSLKTLSRLRIPQVPANSTASVKVDVDLVLVNVTVTDPSNRFVTGLEKDHFKVFEDKVEQKVSQFSTEDLPVSIGLLFDVSGSMSEQDR